MTVSDRGAVSGKKLNLTDIPEESRKDVDRLGSQIQHSFNSTLVPLPNNIGPTSPGATWQATRTLGMDLTRTTMPLPMNITYTYRGTRQQGGREVAVIALRGEMQPIVDNNILTRGRGRDSRGAAA